MYLVLLPLGSAHADAAPPMNPPGGDISPEGQTEVEMVAEEVVIDFRQSSDDSAQVTAWFLLRNTGTVDEHLVCTQRLSGGEGEEGTSGNQFVPIAAHPS